MDSNLILYDIDHFLDKYTRFITKNIYISNRNYCRFLDQYQYLYQILEKDRYLYSDNAKYQKIMDIKKNKNQLIKLHNQKYLQKAIKENQSFFEEIFPNEELDLRKKSLILSEEDQMLVILSKKIESLIIGKIMFLLKKQEYLEKELLILTESLEQKNNLLEKVQYYNLNISIKTIKEYGLALKDREEQVLDDDKKYMILSNYLINNLFLDKEAFQKLYNAFSKYIYLNKDYKDYETFNDYHNYMYKRKFLASNLTLKKFNEQEIKKRRTYLRTIQNEVMKTKEEVDIANFLYLNSISYQYNHDTSTFSIWLDEKANKIEYRSEKQSLTETKNTEIDSTIYLYSSYTEKKSPLEALAYELIKRRYPFELIDENSLYNKLKDTTIENYFSEFIRKYLIPTMDYYEENHTLTDTKLNIEEQQVMIELYTSYEQELHNHNYIKQKDLLSRIKQDILKKNYHYLFLIGNISFPIKIPTMTIIPDYQEVELLKENIKLLYDYKKYLLQNQTLPIAHTYLDFEELNILTISFLKENLKLINKTFEENKKEIDIRYYDDNNRLHIYQNISSCCNDLLDANNQSTLFAFTNLKDMNLLISSHLFSKCDKNTLFTNQKKKIPCEEILKISKLYNTIIIPYLMIDHYHEDFLKTDYDYYIKVMLYVSLSKCREKIILLCPKSRKEELRNLLKNLKKPKIKE